MFDRSKLVPRGLAGLAVVAATVSVLSMPAGAQWAPQRTVEIVVASGPGGGNDKTARVLQQILKETGMLNDVVVGNRPGASGTVAYSYVAQRRGDGHVISVARTGLLANHIIGSSPINYTDLTPLAMVRDEAHAIAVAADSPIKSINDIVLRLKANPKSLGIALGSSRGSTTEFLVAKLAKAASIDPRTLKVVTFDGGTASVTNLLGGHVELAALGIGNFVELHKAGKLRMIGIATEKRAQGLPDVPTFREQGFDVLQSGWTGIMGAPNLTPQQIAYWEETLEKATRHPLWTKLLEESYDDYWFLKATATRDFLRSDYTEVQGLLNDLGLLK
ncbi:MAG: Bug family tripartite tricarboxylate transporter substrate binding protein [Rhodospirillales bacterium]|jgi:putative tricarboxylic transport membrane protein